jgi:MerR family copper efflux transcriptional regulator
MLKIGELAEQAGVNHRTLRYYERMGLMQPAHRAESGHRYYNQTSLVRLKRIQQLKSLGLSLEDIAEIIDAYFTPPEGRPARQEALASMQEHLALARTQLDELRAFEQQLVSSITRMEIYLDNDSP